MNVVARFALPSALVAGFTFTGPEREARADEARRDKCVSANEGAQALRQAGKLQAARERLLLCIAPGCPVPVREDCVERLNELEQATPTITFSAKGPAGNDLSAVVVTMDGALLADRLERAPLIVDPGRHVFTFTTNGYPPVSRELAIREGVRGRQEVITFGGGATTAAPAEAATGAGANNAITKQGSDGAGWSGQKTLALGLAGGGALAIGVGVLLGLSAKSRFDEASSHCAGRQCDQEGTQIRDDATATGNIGTAVSVVGVAALLGGGVLWLTAPSPSRDAAARSGVVRVGVIASGVTIGGLW